MLPERLVRLEYARAASADEINSLVYEADEKFLLALLENPIFHEKHAALLLGRVDAPASAITAVAEMGKGKWMASENIRLRLAWHPHTPRRIALAAVKQLYLFDLVRLSLLSSAQPDIRRIAEETILARVPQLPVGQKLTLARRGPTRVAAAILAEGHPQAIKLALGNAFLTESQVLRVLAKDGVPECVVVAISKDAKWSCRYNVRLALIRNSRAPLSIVRSFLTDVTLRDLHEIRGMRELSEDVQQLIAAELARRSTDCEDVAVRRAPGAA
jgi:hypothetical protein